MPELYDRRMRADLAPRRMHRRCRLRHRAVFFARADPWTRGRRKLSLCDSGRYVEARRALRGRTLEHAHSHPRTGDGRYLHRWAWCGYAQDGLSARGTWRRRARTDGTHQAIVRSARYPESGQSRAYLSNASFTFQVNGVAAFSSQSHRHRCARPFAEAVQSELTGICAEARPERKKARKKSV